MDKVPGAGKNDSSENSRSTYCEDGWQELTFASRTRCFRNFGEIKGEEIISTCSAHNATILTPKNETELDELYELYKNVSGIVTILSLNFISNILCSSVKARRIPKMFILELYDVKKIRIGLISQLVKSKNMNIGLRVSQAAGMTYLPLGLEISGLEKRLIFLGTTP